MQYMKAKEVSEALGVHINRVQLRMKQMRPFVGTLYPQTAMLMDDHTYRVNLDYYIEFCNTRPDLKS